MKIEIESDENSGVVRVTGDDVSTTEALSLLIHTMGGILAQASENARDHVDYDALRDLIKEAVTRQCGTPLNTALN